jgi:hypothetical protein
MKYICTVSLFFLLFSSCDYFANYRFIVVNNTNYDLVIKTSTKIYDNGFNFPDSIHVVKPGEKIEFWQDLGVCGKHYIPDDIYVAEDTIPKTSKFDMYIDGELQRALRLRSNWRYENRKQEGSYTLYIIPEYLEKKE